MMLNSENNGDALLDLIPPAKLEPHQIAVSTKDGQTLPTYRFLRAPSTFDELDSYSDGVVIGMDNGTLVLMGKWFPASPVAEFKKSFSLTSRVCVKIYGDSDDAILETAVFFGTLESSKTKLEINFSDELSIDSTRAESLSLILDKNKTKRIRLKASDIKEALCTVIATRPYPIYLTLDGCNKQLFDAFVTHLEGRTQLFGSLVLIDDWLDQDDIRPLFHHLHLFENLHINLLPDDLILKLLSAPMKSIAFTFCGDGDEEFDLTTTDITIKEIRIDVLCLSEEDFSYTSGFLESFLHRVGQLGHLESLTLNVFGDQPVSVDVGEALIHAVNASKKLRTLVWDEYVSICAASMKGLFAVLENHKEMRTLKIAEYPTSLDPEFVWLKRLLKRNRLINVRRAYDCKLSTDDEVDDIISLNHFFHGSERLKKAPTALRPLLMAAALTHTAARDFQRAGLLLNDHVDVLCDFLHALESTDDTKDIRMEAETEGGDLSSVIEALPTTESNKRQKLNGV